jgi:hypothetical protein
MTEQVRYVDVFIDVRPVDQDAAADELVVRAFVGWPSGSSSDVDPPS